MTPEPAIGSCSDEARLRNIDRHENPFAVV
jgi:hypothetical protein